MPKTQKPKTEQRITAGMPAQEFWDMFPEEEPANCKYHRYRYNCVVDGQQGPMHPRYDLIRDMGMPHLLSIISGTGKLPEGDLTFIFPDRWLTPGQAQQFAHKLNNHPDIIADQKAGRRRTVLVVTHQPYVISSCLKEQIRVIKDEGGDGGVTTLINELTAAGIGLRG